MDRPVDRPAGTPARPGLAMLVLAAVLAAVPAGAQVTGTVPADPDGAGAMISDPGAAPAAMMPLIAAPDDPARSVPGGGIVGSETPAYNSFLGGETMPAPVEDFAPPALPVVVELFTSQGCSSCPPVDAMLAQLSAEPGVLPLSLHVDYWDYLGWSDSFARPEFTDRQEGYARASGERALYTPQLIVDGRDTAVAPGPAQLMALIDANRVSPAMVGVRRESTGEGEMIELLPLSDLGGAVDILLVRYAPERRVEVTAGENRGRTVTYINVVLGMDQLAHWDGARALRLTVRPGDQPGDGFPPDTRHVLLVQEAAGGDELPGPILAAIQLD
ncbi:DUF1223 domain-containing protein [Paracoccus marinaquae]|uniref:DUF1223 domain-containing protein n=1 Tax=Paracoccus marinaquae TaxID=2841926 RepID=A0ABS6ALB6_9RHOB|nr:DUF1223 domain-containing protein [Paracoccus marinaquae]MBU3031385.1 DUF1223 domain-containing protein [Paracoccus marinaquae]